jgi:predicted aspartyl protease
MNGYSIELRFLLDTGANGFAFVNIRYATDIASFLGMKLVPLPTPIPVKGYDGKSRVDITQILRIYLIIDGRRLFNLPLLVLAYAV